MSAAKPQAKETVQQSIVSKVQMLADRMRELVARNKGMELQIGAQQAEIKDLKTRVRHLEETRKEARARLQKVASELPER